MSDLVWMDQALCRNMNPAIFFPKRGDVRAAALAKAVCARCPVRQPCKDFRRGENGIWGGVSDRDVRAERKAQRGRGAA